MHKLVSTGLGVLLSVGGVPFSAAASRQDVAQTATLTGTSYLNDRTPLSSARVQLRNIGTGELVASTTSGQSGEYQFAGLPPGSYIVEVVDGSGVLGMTAPFTLAAGASATVSVWAVARGTAARSDRGFSLFGLGPVASMAVLGAAGAAAVTAVVATSPDASPSR